MRTNDSDIKGRGAQDHYDNPYHKQSYDIIHEEGIDEFPEENNKTRYIEIFPKTIINKVNSPDIPCSFSINPYQGCEHGCIYCYARNSHQYWGYDAGLDFEQQVLVKKNAPALLENTLSHSSWEAAPVMFSGNTDCYQPAEKKYEITHQLLKIFLKYQNPVSLITKNSAILRDTDILETMASKNLIHVNISIPTLNEELRRKLEPRTASGQQKLKTIEKLNNSGIPVNVLIAPVIPSLNSHEITDIIKKAYEAGASKCNYLIVRLNGNTGKIFEDWLRQKYPDRAEKVINQIKECHKGNINDSRFGKRMKGEGAIADSIANIFHIYEQKYFKDKFFPSLNTNCFKKSSKGQLNLFQ